VRDFAGLTYVGKHARVRRVRGKADRCIIFLCNTGSTLFEWANISHRYIDVWDFMPMCIIHHNQYDGVSDEARANISAAGIGKHSGTGRKHTEESKAKMSSAKLGNQNARGKRTDESRARMSAAHDGLKVSEASLAGLVAGRVTQKAASYPALKAGRNTMKDSGFSNLAKARCKRWRINHVPPLPCNCGQHTKEGS
jgi:hypothetical protein